MEKTYNPHDFEQEIYKNWLDKKYFHAKVDKNKVPYSIIMPPPNVTSNLHMGHAFQQTIQDIIIRRKRMQGFNAMWLPGTDHAAISTESMIVKKLAKEGKSKESLGREAFSKEVEEWYKQYKGTIIDQFKSMGFSCDWDRLAFTMDEQNCKAVRYVFVHLYKKGWIYKANRIVNWCPHCKSSISDAEVEFKEVPSFFWHLRYQIEGTNEYINLATTRPETMLGDTAVAVNPSDERYKHLVGKNVILPILNKPIPVVADDYVEKDFGTGVVKITPAHDPNDFQVGKRHNLPVINIMNSDGTMNENCGEYQGLTREEAREKIVKELERIGALVKIEPYSHNVGHCERCKTIIEPLVSNQWWVKVDELRKPAIKVVEEDKVHFVDEQYKKSYLHWMRNLQDWCISRQLWTGHQIPAFTCDNCGNVMVEMEDPSVCSKCGSKHLKQEVDTLDTWFSSALWPLSTLGFPDKTPDIEYFYPTNVLVTAREIINLWVARMIFSGLEYYGDIPFKDIVINGIVKDAHGKKMSKTLGNGTDPRDVIKNFGVDTLRFSLFDGISIGSDSRFSEKKVELSRNFLNKVWNASRYVLMQLEGKEVKNIEDVKLNLADKWILTELNALIESVDKKFEKYDIGMAESELSDFFWTKFCDWYIELSKTDMQGANSEATVATLCYVLTALLKLLHPFIPFITEKIYQELPMHDESIVISQWPKPVKSFENEKENMQEIIAVIKAIRNARAEKNLPDNKKIGANIFCFSKKELFASCEEQIKKLSLLNALDFVDKEEMLPQNAVVLTFNNCKIALPLDSLVDSKEEKQRLSKEIEKVKFEITRSEKMLSNDGFVAKAPQALIDGEKAKLEKNRALLEKLEKDFSAI
jgi:valyl-tRNA synthetase